ncbi:MAG: ribonuclease Y [Synergistetes bacterium]|nr:ribonuclease Y [Synergistota bacterium]MCX8127859.1 ribonuclease Y [Synergistota bacterium]MDW8192121.1 ribonuclease Y [Synergistota bacterium]
MITIGFSYLINILMALAGGIAFGYWFRKHVAEKKIKAAEDIAKDILARAEKEGEALKREKVSEAREEIQRLRSDWEREYREKRSELQRFEKRLLQKEELLERRGEVIARKEEDLKQREREIEELRKEAERLVSEQKTTLEKIAGLTSEEAKNLLLEEARKEIEGYVGLMIKEMEAQAKREAERKAREIISLAIQRCAVDHVVEATVSVVPLPNDDMKGRIIGREGRNIRTFETITGADLIVDDTPEAVIVSCHNPIRREIARRTLEKLIADGRIHPARIEEMYEKALRELEDDIREAGEDAVFQAKVGKMHSELVRLLGMLKYRTSYGQNILTHSLEVAHLAGVMAAELGEDVLLAKRAGLLHDIGKAVDTDVEGTHSQIGAELARKYGESQEVIHAIEAHHSEVEPQSVIAVLVQAADAISASRPGARRESFEEYIKRLENLERIASSFNGIEKAYAIQAGREVRVIVKPEIVDDAVSAKLAYEIARKIEGELKYPGQIKVTVIREMRSVDYAK